MTKSPSPSLNDYQARISKLIIERGYDKETISEVFTLLVEEVGELAKAIRKINGQKIGSHPNSTRWRTRRPIFYGCSSTCATVWT